MSRNIFLTGFPGFIAKQLVHRLVERDGDARFIFLIQEHLRSVAEEALRELDRDVPGLGERCELVPGDITRERLGMSETDHADVVTRTTDVWHLAAIYDLSVPEDLAYKVNVTGTSNVLDLCEACSQLRRLDYISTCYVSGTRTGIVMESELDEGQSFKNHYESTKCWAEVEVRRRMDRVPTAIHRPSIVIGDSRTGYTDKYDGPYYLILLLMRLPSFIPMVNVGRGAARPSLVPVDFVVDAMAEIWSKDSTLGKTFQLADPNPHSARQIVESISTALDRAKPFGTLPAGLVEATLSSSLARKLIRMPKESVVYFNHEVDYDTTNTRAALADSDVRCPDLLAIIPTIVDYVRQNPEKGFLDGRRL